MVLHLKWWLSQPCTQFKLFIYKNGMERNRNRIQKTVLKLNLLHCWWYQNISRQDGNKFYVQSLNCEFVSSFTWTCIMFSNKNNWSWINMCDADLKICYKPKIRKKKNSTKITAQLLIRGKFVTNLQRISLLNLTMHGNSIPFALVTVDSLRF